MKHFIRLVLIIALFLEAFSFLFKLFGAVEAVGFVYFCVFICLFILIFSLAGLSVLVIKGKFGTEIFRELKPEIVIFLCATCLMTIIGITDWH